MFTVSKVAQISGLNRRVVQFWADREVIIASDLLEKPRVYPVVELEVVMALRPLAAIEAPIKIVTLAAGIFRQFLENEGNPADEAEAGVQNAIAAARKKEPAFLVLRIDGRTNAAVFPAVLEVALASIIAQQLKDSPQLPVIVINLTEALNWQKPAAQRVKR